jgi:hypothetical protein
MFPPSREYRRIRHWTHGDAAKPGNGLPPRPAAETAACAHGARARRARGAMGGIAAATQKKRIASHLTQVAESRYTVAVVMLFIPDMTKGDNNANQLP